MNVCVLTDSFSPQIECDGDDKQGLCLSEVIKAPQASFQMMCDLSRVSVCVLLRHIDEDVQG